MSVSVQTLRRQQWLPLDLETVFPFFANAENLEKLTPPWLGFHILTPTPISMRPGALIDYRILLHGLPLRWQTEITVWEPPYRFVDTQLKGPYQLWKHEHRFQTVNSGTLVTDQIEYRIPLDWLPGSNLVRRILVEPDLHRIFEFRRIALLRHFGLTESDCIPSTSNSPASLAPRPPSLLTPDSNSKTKPNPESSLSCRFVSPMMHETNRPMSHPLLRNRYSDRSFPPFSLTRLLQTVFAPKGGERICILIDLANPSEMKDFAFLKKPELTIQKLAHEVFYQGLREGGLSSLGLRGGNLFAYEITGGSNLDLPETVVDAEGHTHSFQEAVYSQFDLVLCISTYSATAPLTAFAKQFGFRGATLHGLNEIILSSGLAVDYNEVSAAAEKLRLGLTRADWVEIDFEVLGQRATLRLELGGQEAQKSHGLCRGGPDVANLPAGEVYFVPKGASGAFPMRYEDGTLGLMRVDSGRIVEARLLRGNPETIATHNAKLTSDPVTGEIGELGFGTQELPPSGRDIQDEKILGTLHVATGRSDHLGGHLTPDRFKTKRNATHDDILFSSTKTPEIQVPQARFHRDGQTHIVIENYLPSAYLTRLLAP